MKIMRYFILAISFFICTTICAQNTLFQSQIEKIANSEKGMTVGVAIKGLDEGTSNEIFSINGNAHFPMQSVYKFPLALAVLHQVDQGKLSLEQKIKVTKKDLLPNTWSPLRKKYPEGNVDIALKDLLSYMVSQSDNNACDILFRLMGGPKEVEKYIHSLGIKGIAIVGTEEEMHDNWNIQFTNWAEPLALMQLLDLFYQKKLLEKPTHDFLWKIMVETSTGANKIKALLPEGSEIAHKSGSSGKNEKGEVPASNDIGIVTLPNGKRFSIVVMVSSKKKNTDEGECEKIIAQIAKIAWDYYQSR